MSSEISIYNESLSGTRTAGPTITIDSGLTTVRELIGKWVESEVAGFRERATHTIPETSFQLQESERILNCGRQRGGKNLDLKEQIEKACRAFERQAFFL